MTVGATVLCGPWIEGTAAVARHLALASTAATVVRSTFAPDAEALPHDDPPCVAQTLLAA